MQLISSLSVVLVQAQRLKILCLHGGGGTGSGFQKYVEDLQNALPEYEFVYTDGAYGGNNSFL